MIPILVPVLLYTAILINKPKPYEVENFCRSWGLGAYPMFRLLLSAGVFLGTVLVVIVIKCILDAWNGESVIHDGR